MRSSMPLEVLPHGGNQARNTSRIRKRQRNLCNSKDLCMIQHPELIGTGISSMKIEGRMKSAYYVATVVKAYREALDSYYKDPES